MWEMVRVEGKVLGRVERVTVRVPIYLEGPLLELASVSAATAVGDVPYHCVDLCVFVLCVATILFLRLCQILFTLCLCHSAVLVSYILDVNSYLLEARANIVLLSLYPNIVVVSRTTTE
jgi:hypothetical protein